MAVNVHFRGEQEWELKRIAERLSMTPQQFVRLEMEKIIAAHRENWLNKVAKEYGIDRKATSKPNEVQNDSPGGIGI